MFKVALCVLFITGAFHLEISVSLPFTSIQLKAEKPEVKFKQTNGTAPEGYLLHFA
jgi:hypothetical protein